MSPKSTRTIVAVGALGLATIAPAAASAHGPALGGRTIAGGLGGGNAGGLQKGARIGNNVAPNVGRGIVPLASQNHLSNFVGSHAQVRCRIVQVGNPRANPPMLVCP